MRTTFGFILTHPPTIQFEHRGQINAHILKDTFVYKISVHVSWLHSVYQSTNLPLKSDNKSLIISNWALILFCSKIWNFEGVRFFSCLQFEQPSVPRLPTHLNPNVVRIIKSAQNNGRSLTSINL